MKQPFLICLMLYYCNLNVIGTVYLTRTGLPLCLPGVHLGMVPITRRASLSNDGSTPRNTSASTTDPSRFTTNAQITRPWIPFPVRLPDT